MDSKGVIYNERGDELPKHKKTVARSDGQDVPHSKDLKEVVAHIKPHALIGLTGRGPAFTEVHPDMEKPLLETNVLMLELSDRVPDALNQKNEKNLCRCTDKPAQEQSLGHRFPLNNSSPTYCFPFQ